MKHRIFPVMTRSLGLAAAFLFLVCAALPAHAALMGDVVGATSKPFGLVLTQPSGSGGGNMDQMQQAINRNMGLLPIFAMINPQGVAGGAVVASPGGQGVDFRPFLNAGADFLITSHWPGGSSVELRLFGVADGRFIFGNRYEVVSGTEGVYDVADKFCADLLDDVIGNGAFFRSNMAFIRSGGRHRSDVWVMKANGRHLRRISDLVGEALSPAWSPDGRFVVFSHIDKRTHGLGVWDSTTRTVQRIRFPGNTVIGPTFMPDNRVAVSLTDGRNPSIFLLNHAFQKDRKLDNSAAIDVSPSVDASGSKMVFTSSRLGSPQIFLKDLRGGGVSRITMSGGYNTDPSISPDGTVVVFARMIGSQHRIFAYDLLSGQERQITDGPGSDEEPAFSPDSFFVAFMSTRQGRRQIYVTTRNGGPAKMLPTGGDGAFPAWGPARK